MLPKANQFAISEVKVNIKGRDDGNRDVSNDSRNNFSEYVPMRASGTTGVKNSIPGFSRILSANTNMQRRDLSQKLSQRDHGDLLDKDIKKLAEEWDGDPHDPDFWKRFEGENSQS